jgi:hypothetical protein
MREKKNNKDQNDPNQQDKSKENENAQKEMEHISENVDDNDKQQSLERNKVNAEENDWITVVYSGKWYVGQVMEIDNEDGEYFVDFLETTGKIPNRFRRPNQHDSIWIEPEKVLYVLSEPPAKIGGRERSMKIVDTDFENIEKIFSKI